MDAIESFIKDMNKENIRRFPLADLSLQKFSFIRL